MARLVLAAAFEQAPGWPAGATEPAPTDYFTQGNLIASQFAFGNPQFVHKEIEVMAGGAMTWNHGVDYADLLARSGSIDRVRYWYAKAGLDLDADLATLAHAPRFAAKPAAVGVVEDKATMNGQTGGAPVFSVKTIGDPADPVSLDEAYVRTFHEAGNDAPAADGVHPPLRAQRQSLLERLTAFQTLVNRLDSGQWGDTSPTGLNAVAADIAAHTTLTAAQLGTSLFTDFQPVPTLRTWDFLELGHVCRADAVRRGHGHAGSERGRLAPGLGDGRADRDGEPDQLGAVASLLGDRGGRLPGDDRRRDRVRPGHRRRRYDAHLCGERRPRERLGAGDGDDPDRPDAADAVGADGRRRERDERVRRPGDLHRHRDGRGQRRRRPRLHARVGVAVRDRDDDRDLQRLGRRRQPGGSEVVPVIVTRPCITGSHTGPLKVAAGDAVCVGAGSIVTGPVTVGPGATLDVEGGMITGPVRVFQSATPLRLGQVNFR